MGRRFKTGVVSNQRIENNTVTTIETTDVCFMLPIVAVNTLIMISTRTNRSIARCINLLFCTRNNIVVHFEHHESAYQHVE